MKIRIILLVLFIAAMYFISCAPRETSKALPELKEEAKKPEVYALLPWEKEWQKLVMEAKKEGNLNLYLIWGPDEKKAIVDAFKKDFGIEISTVVGRGEEIAVKVITEHRYGLYLADVYIGGASTLFGVMKPAGVIDPIAPVLLHPDLTEPERVKQVWYGGELGWLDKERYFISFRAAPNIIIFVNTNLVKPQEIASYQDLLNPKWKGKITWNDPTTGGGGSNAFSFFLHDMGGRDFIEQLVKQDIILIRDLRLQVDWLVQGKYPIAIGARQASLEEAVRAGAPITGILPKEGTYLTLAGGTMSLIKKAPHPSAARLFMNWILTKEVQTLWSKAYGSQSKRTDVPYDHLKYPREPGKTYMVLDTEERLLMQGQDMKLAGEILKPLLK